MRRAVIMRVAFGAGLLALTASAALAAEPYRCTLAKGCGTSDCGSDAPVEATLTPTREGWVLESASDIAGTFAEIMGDGEARHFVSVDIDEDANAVALLSLFEGGAAFLSIHGPFLAPSAGTYSGQCTRETS